MQHKNKLLLTLPQIVSAVLILSCTISTASAQTFLPAEDIAEKALAATVYLEMKDINGKTLGIGSGFFVKRNIIATNYHVIEGAAKGTAKLVGKDTRHKIEGIAAMDKDNDLVLLKIAANVSGIKPLALGDSNKVRIGETVYVTGNPKGLEGTFSRGNISSQRGKDTKERLQMTAPISPGSSGGPVLNRNGLVIGVCFMTIEGGQNLNFAIPSKYLKILIERAGGAKPIWPRNTTISAETYFQWGYTMDGMGNYAFAIVSYTEAIRLKPDYVEAYVNRGIAKASLGQYVAAIEDYDTAIRLKPDFALVYNNRGATKVGLGQYFAAIEDYDIAIRLKPDYAEAYNNRGIAKADLGQYDASIKDFDTAIRLKPDIVSVYVNRGVAKVGLGQYFAAIEDYNIAIRLKPDYAEAYNNRGMAKADLGQYNAAIKDYDIAIRLKPDYAEAYHHRGAVKLALGQYDASIKDFDTAIRLKPDHARAYYGRGLSKAELNRRWEAKQDLNTALRLAVQTEDADLRAAIEKALLIPGITDRVMHKNWTKKNAANDYYSGNIEIN